MFDWLKKIFKPRKFLRHFESAIKAPYKVRDWQIRERNIVWNMYDVFPYDIINKSDIGDIHKIMLRKFKQEPDTIGIDYWKTSFDAFVKMSGDCEDFAVALWRSLKQNNYKNIGMIFVGEDANDKRGHICVGWHHKNYNFWVFDNGYLTNKPMLASKLFPITRGNRQIRPIFGFNDVSFWFYNDK